MLFLHNHSTHTHASLGSCCFLISFLLVCNLSLFSCDTFFLSLSLTLFLSLSVLPAHHPSLNPFPSPSFTVTPVSSLRTTVVHPSIHNMGLFVDARKLGSVQLLLHLSDYLELVSSISASSVSLPKGTEHLVLTWFCFMLRRNSMACHSFMKPATLSK